MLSAFLDASLIHAIRLKNALQLIKLIVLIVSMNYMGCLGEF
ncbi:hypothetical protein N483_00310 [Pseudoalteromonas luteoviolacea NCIMB 1944]|nr:hypothetical protein N483_00310 [Pseudoalteromonas luteoviolacea NCIMB 1944]